MYRAVTRQIEVSVEPFFLPDSSDPGESRFVWGYRITIDNQSTEAVQLLSRYWHITDARGRVEEVRRNSIPATAISIRRDARFRRRPA
jgi:ApaG protein